MTFRSMASIDANQHKGLILLNSISGSPLVATGLSLTNSQPMHVAIVDGTGSQITSFGGGTQYAELTTTAPGTGTLALGRYKSSAPTLTDGQMYGLQLDANGYLAVNIKAGAGSGGTASTDDSAFTAGSGSGTPMMGFATSDAVDSGDVGVVAMDVNRNLKVIAQSNSGVDIGDVTINNGAGAAAVNIQDGGNTITVDGTVAATQSGAWNITDISGTISLPAGAATSALQSTGNTTLSTIATNTTDLPNVIGTDGAAGPSKAVSVAGTDGSGNLQELINDNTDGLLVNLGTNNDVTIAANSSVNVNQIGGNAVSAGNGASGTGVQRVTIANDSTGVLASIGSITTSVVPGTGATNLGKAEDGGHTTGDTGVFALAVRQDTPNTATTNTDADYSQVSVSSTGALRIAPISEDFAALANGPQVKKYYTNAGAVTDGIVWSPAAGKRWYVTDLILNVSAACTVTLEDDLAAGDSPVMKFELAANSGVSHVFNTPLFSGEDAADLLVTTTAGNVYITVVGYEI